MLTRAVKNKRVQFIRLGEVDYQACWQYQENLFQKSVNIKVANRKRSVQERTHNYLIFCSHRHVFTLGRSGNKNNLLLNPKQLKKNNAQFYKINRGGDITYHGPGQLVGYPIFDLDHFFTDIHKFLRFLEEAVILTLAEYGIKAGRIAGLTGVWLDENKLTKARKICALGVKSSRWVTMHGFALNVNTDLSYFQYIVPCGIQGKEVTSLQKELGRAVDMKEVEVRLKKQLEKIFEIKWVT